MIRRDPTAGVPQQAVACCFRWRALKTPGRWIRKPIKAEIIDDVNLARQVKGYSGLPIRLSLSAEDV